MSTWALHSKNLICKAGIRCWYCASTLRSIYPLFIKKFEAGHGNRTHMRSLANRSERLFRIKLRADFFSRLFKQGNPNQMVATIDKHKHFPASAG